jgi:cell division protein ZapD
MNDPAQELPVAQEGLKFVEYELPLTERMRTFLRLEFLYQQVLFHAEDRADFGSRAAIAGLLEISTILGRGDVRADTLKELEKQADSLRHYGSQPGVDQSRLGTLLDNVEQLRVDLLNIGPHFLQPIKESEFLSAIKHRSSIPGGTCVFDLPDYAFWLSLPFSTRSEQMEHWLGGIRPLCDAVAEVLWLVREMSDPEELVAVKGMYQRSSEHKEQLNLVRVLLPAESDLYTEISGGQHRITVRFLRISDVNARPMQATENISFLLGLC